MRQNTENNITFSSLLKEKKDISHLVKKRSAILMEIAVKIWGYKKKTMDKNMIELLIPRNEDKTEVLSILDEISIIEKISYDRYKVNVETVDEIINIFDNVNFIPQDQPYKFTQTIGHKKLGEKITLTSENEYQLQRDINYQIELWENKWRLIEPEYERNSLLSILADCLYEFPDISDFFDYSTFTIDKPIKKDLERFSLKKPIPPSNKFSFNKKKRIEEYEIALKRWENRKKENENKNNSLEEEYKHELEKWSNDFEDFISKQSKHNQFIEDLLHNYNEGSTKGIEDYFMFILSIKTHPLFSKNKKITFEKESKIIALNVELPSIDEFPKIKERSFIKSRGEYKEKPYTQKELSEIYEESIYQYILLIIHEIIRNDSSNHIDSISVNGWISSLNKGTGKYGIKFITSIFTSREEFEQIDLSLVDSKECFKNLKGLSGKLLSDITPIKPIINTSFTDKRFIEAINIAERINEHTNLAAMDWEDFEYLVRELFEKEFIQNGGAVKVTQASKDGGVDAIAFDRDPIKGGKIVIQAKRYTNVVGVSAVRDLYGTILNEGANKGILVTTSNFGSDSYDFAKDKPITLLNGGELLYLLEKHGYKARIDINEAKMNANLR